METVLHTNGVPVVVYMKCTTCGWRSVGYNDAERAISVGRGHTLIARPTGEHYGHECIIGWEEAP